MQYGHGCGDLESVVNNPIPGFSALLYKDCLNSSFWDGSATKYLSFFKQIERWASLTRQSRSSLTINRTSSETHVLVVYFRE